MKIKQTDIIIDKKNPFQNCKLNREIYASILTDIIKSYPEGFVLAINNEWGTGKTTFVKMWKQYLANKDYTTLYFNAWENDFDKNPLVALISELKVLKTSLNEDLFKSVIQKGSILAKNILPRLLKGILKNYIDADTVLDAIENTTQGITEIFEEEIKEYSNKKQSISEFRSELEEFVQKSNNGKPLVFIIDELDRCRPNYAVEVLEQIKHFFTVPGIIFVLSIDKVQLGYAIRGVYGNDRINSDEYLRRFIDLEYSIPAPSSDTFCLYLYDYYHFDDFFLLDERREVRQFQNDKDLFLKMVTLLFQKTNATLRQQEKILGHTRVVLNSFNLNSYVFPHLLFFLIYIKIVRYDLYSKIENNAISLQELSDEYSDLVLSDLRNLHGINLLYIEAMLLSFYNNQQGSQKEILYERKEDGQLVTTVNSKLENNLGIGSTLGACLEAFSKEFRINDIEIMYLLKKINLMDPMV